MWLAIGLDPAMLLSSIVTQKLLFEKLIEGRIEITFQTLSPLHAGYGRGLGSAQIAAAVARIVRDTKCGTDTAARWRYTMLMVLMLLLLLLMQLRLLLRYGRCKRIVASGAAVAGGQVHAKTRMGFQAE